MIPLPSPFPSAIGRKKAKCRENPGAELFASPMNGAAEATIVQFDIVACREDSHKMAAISMALMDSTQKRLLALGTDSSSFQSTSSLAMPSIGTEPGIFDTPRPISMYPSNFLPAIVFSKEPACISTT